MTSAVKSFLVVLLALPLLIYLGSEVGNDEYLLPLTIVGVMLAGLFVALFFRGQRLESLVLAFLLFGYLVGNRSFAQISFTQPFFVGEVGLALIIGVMVVRFVLTRELQIPDHPLTWLVGAYLFVAALRAYFDLSTYGFEAARDLAIVYYALFFFLAYQIGRREQETQFLDRTLKWAFFSLAIVSLLLITSPNWLESLVIAGNPIFAQKGDLVGTFAGIGIFFLILHAESIRPAAWRWAVIGILLACIALIANRAAVVAMMGTFIVPWAARFRSFRLYPALFVLIAAVGLAVVALLPSDGPLSTVQDQVASTLDVSGNYSYKTNAGDEKAADNTFRRMLWLSFYSQTVQDNQWFLGKGFGYDFIPQFEVEYRAGSWSTLRSAHNYYVTVFGRLGVVGISLLLGITYYVIRGGLQAASAYRRGEAQDTSVLFYWCGAWAILISGTFGVVMEGPMGAIPFWSFLGLALGADPRILSRSDRAKIVAQPVLVGPTWKEPATVPFRASR